MKRLALALTAIVFLLWLGPPLLAVALDADGLRHDYTDADQLFRAAPLAAITGIVKIKGDDQDAQYLLRARIVGPPSLFTGTAWGWQVTWQGGNGLEFTRGREKLSGTCERFSGGFEVCRLRRREAHHLHSQVWGLRDKVQNNEQDGE